MRGRVWQRPVPRGGERRAGQAHGPMTRRETSCRREWPVTLSMIQPEKGVVGVGVLVARAGGEYRRMGGGEVEFLADRPNLRGVSGGAISTAVGIGITHSYRNRKD
jgi:hypothetical protein